MRDITKLLNPFHTHPKQGNDTHSLLARITATYLTTAGTVKWPSTEHSDDKTNEHIGIFDYATLGIPYFIGKATYYTGNTATNAIRDTTNLGEPSQQNKSRLGLLAIIPIIPLMALNTTMTVMRHTVATSSTLLLTPLIGIYYGGSKLINTVNMPNSAPKEQATKALATNQYRRPSKQLTIPHKTNYLGKERQLAYFDCSKSIKTVKPAKENDCSRINLPR